MTTSQPQYSAPAAAVSGWLNDADEQPAGEPVGAADAEADRQRAGATDADLTDGARDTDDVPVGRADAEADARRTGADPADI